MPTVEGFELVDLIGQGGFGTVHRARDVAHGRYVAVKVLPMALDESSRRRFDRERRAMGRVSGHPGIGIVHTSGTTTDHEPFIVMELLTGGSLADRVAAHPLTAREAATVGLAMADALGAAHVEGILHLDVKPENILFSQFGTPKLVDFGIAALADDDEGTATVRATPAFAAPEVLDGEDPTELADVYGLAATLFAAIAGQPPYGGSSSLAVLRSIAVDPVPQLDRSLASSDLVDLLYRSMSREPSERPSSMREFGSALASIDPSPAGTTSAASLSSPDPDRSGTVGNASDVPVSTPPSPAPPPRTGQRAGLLLLGVSAFVVIAALGVSSVLGGDDTDPSEDAGAAGLETPVTSPGVSTLPAAPDTAAPESAEPTTVAVPDLSASTAEQAVLSARNVGLLVEIPAYCENRIVSQSPAAGISVDPGSTISVEFAPCEVPQFVGLRLPAAIELAEATQGMGVGWPDHCDDLVTGQQPAAGEIVAPNTQIQLELVPC